MCVNVRFLDRSLLCLGMLASVLICACSTAQVNHKLLQESVDDFSHQLRWGDVQQAAAYLPAKAAQIVAAQDDEDIRITAAVVRKVAFPDEATGKVVLAVEWYRQSRGMVRSTTVLQTWRWKDERWKITAQRWLKGPPLPLLPTVDEPDGAEPQS
jgi:hypothetical protein